MPLKIVSGYGSLVVEGSVDQLDLVEVRLGEDDDFVVDVSALSVPPPQVTTAVAPTSGVNGYSSYRVSVKDNQASGADVVAEFEYTTYQDGKTAYNAILALIQLGRFSHSNPLWRIFLYGIEPDGETHTIADDNLDNDLW